MGTGSRTSVFFLLASVCLVAPAWGQEPGGERTPFADTEGAFDAVESAAEGAFDERARLLETLWDRMEAEEEAKWKRLEAEVLEKWDVYRPTTKKIWVDYSANREAVSQVNFETGEVVVEALAPEGATPDQVRAAVAEKLDVALKKKDAAGAPIMEGMLDEAAESEVADGEIAVSRPEPVQGADGVTRLKVGVTLKMVPDHIERRAARFLPRVKEEAGKRDVDPALVLAVMHTESAFNPMARSPVPAFGLMQLVPRFAAKEAYVQLYGKEKVLTPDYLYDPGHNIELGVTYLGRLEQVYFRNITDPVKRRYVAVCAYNWGPTAVSERLLPVLNPNEMSPETLYRSLRDGVPQETRDYLERVEQRRAAYAAQGS